MAQAGQTVCKFQRQLAVEDWLDGELQINLEAQSQFRSSARSEVRKLVCQIRNKKGFPDLALQEITFYRKAHSYSIRLTQELLK